jgi:hypothetical protein
MDRTNDRPTKEQYNMRFKLVHKKSQEIVDTIEVIKTEKQIATDYFQNKKRLSKETFEKLYEVKVYDRD